MKFKKFLNELASEVQPRWSYKFDTQSNLDRAIAELKKKKIDFKINGLTLHFSKQCDADVARSVIGFTQLIASK